ncbi:MAG: polyribonucleotide nucleotidyltransferase [bacterium]|nr:polyribonucleotide nucleotidyltransferase [bacterium]
MEIIHPFGEKTRQFETEFAGRKLIIETGKMAFMADGAVTVRYGDTVVFASAVVASQPSEGADFFPLLIDYEERMYASGKISGSRFVKREGRPSEQALLTARLIDRPIRPLFPKGYRNEVQVVVMVLSADLSHEPDIISIIAASSALMLSGAPFDGPLSAMRIGLIDDKFMLYPTAEELEKSQLNLTVAGTTDAIMMVEAGAKEVSEEKIVKALDSAQKAWQPVIDLQQKMVKEMKVTPKEVELFLPAELAVQLISEYIKDRLGPAIRHSDLSFRHEAISELRNEIIDWFGPKEGEEDNQNRFSHSDVVNAFEKIIDLEVRRAILDENERPDKRKTTEIRPISGQVGLLPRTHGSALFTRGSTQSLSITTLGPTSDAQLIDTMQEDTTKRFMHHYNFPPFSTGEARPMRSTGRREIGHGALAERAIESMIPSIEEFPYAIRVVSEILSSNGSTSMASVCAATLSLMDGGVPIKKPIAGIAMGLIIDHKNPKKYVILSDIAAAEDFAGDMDFKVAGTDSGITALQMDIKVKGITVEIMSTALSQAKEGRAHIASKMKEILAAPRDELSPYAPRITKLKIDPDKIREVIGKGGEVINKIIAETGVEIDIEDDGLVMIASVDEKKAAEAKEWILSIIEEPEIGKIYQGRVVRVMDFGAFVEILPGKEGLVHISQIRDERVDDIHKELKEGDKVTVKMLEIDAQGRLNLSIKAAKK